MADRREFLKQAGIASVGYLTLDQVEAMTSQLFAHAAADEGLLRRSLVPSFMLEDVLRLVHLSDFSDDFVAALQINQQLFHRGAAFRLPDSEWRKLVDKVKNTWGGEGTMDDAQTLLALLAGASLYPIIDDHIPIASSDLASVVPTLTDEQIYHDVWVMKEMQNADPSGRSVPMNEPIEVDTGDVAELFHLVRQRNLIRMHTIRPEFADVETWLEQVLSLQHMLEDENVRYARVYCHPTSTGITRDMNTFYDREDPIIQLARGVQMSVTELTLGLPDSISEAGSQSTYAQVLRQCMLRLGDWYSFVSGKVSRDALIGTLGSG